MITTKIIRYVSSLIGLLCISVCSIAQTTKTQSTKEAYIPTSIWRVPEGNDYNNPESEYSNARRLESDNIVLFWSKEYGPNPMDNQEETKRFDPKMVLATCEEFYRFYANDLKFVSVGNSLSDTYKLLMFVFGGGDGTAYGGGAEDKIGVMWTPAARIHKTPYGALAHEMGHSFQYLAKCDGNWAYSSPIEGSRGNSIFEMTSQYMLWQVYPEWITFENYHLKAFLGKTHYAFLHETNQYHAPFVLEYWATKHGIDFIGKMWRNAIKGEDPVRTYQRLSNISQTAFNDELFDAYRRFVTWDMPRIEKVSAPYANQHYTNLDSISGQRWRIAASHVPQNYGYNAIPLAVPQGENNLVKLQFAGMTTYNNVTVPQPENSGWRYGFIAVSKEGKRTYGETYHNPQGQASFNVPQNTEFLWLVVMGAPREHHVHLIDGKEETKERWPYEIELMNTKVLAKTTGETK